MTFASKKPGKQRYARAHAPLHARRRMLRVHLSRDLRAKLGIRRRALLLHKGDKVRLRRGDDAGKTGSVIEVNYRDLTVYVEGVAIKTAKGVEKLRPIAPGQLEITDGNFGTKDRAALIARSAKGAPKPAPKSAAVPKE